MICSIRGWHHDASYAINDADAGTPAVQFQLSTLGLAQTIRTDGATEWKYVPPHSKNEIQSRSQPVSSLATIECLYLQVLAIGGIDSYRNHGKKTKLLAVSISYS